MVLKQARPAKRRVDGIVLLDKPTGMSSNAALQKVRWLFRAKKAGHTGSLDPLATGVLPLCFGEATKLCHYLLAEDKTYEVTARLGIRTTTSDSEGECVSTRPIPILTEAILEKYLDKYRGAIMQVPSMYSALKYNGQPLYQLARQGITVDRPARAIHIYENHLLSLMQETLSLRVSCSKGTYIRSLIDDLGEDLGCGAHVTALRRIRVAGYDETQTVSLNTLVDCFEQEGEQALLPYLQDLSLALPSWPIASLSDDEVTRIWQGQQVLAASTASPGLVKLQDQQGQLHGIGEVLADGQLKPKRLIHPSTPT
jgi:tRNA pseudouridine55 synthase